MAIIERIKELDNATQIDILLDFLQEVGGSIQVSRNQFYLYWAEQMGLSMQKHIETANAIKARIKELSKL